MENIAFGYFKTACRQLFESPLYAYFDGDIHILMLPGEQDIADAAGQYLTAAVSCGQMTGRTLRITIAAPEYLQLQDKFGSSAMAIVEAGLAQIEFVPEAGSAEGTYAICGADRTAECADARHSIVMRCDLEPSDELVRLTNNVNYAYECTKEPSVSFEKMTEKLWKEDMYSLRSSMAAAVHIPYKLKSLGIDVDTASVAAAAAEFEQAYCDKTAGELLCLEHSRWQVYMIMDGYRLPTKQQIEGYAFENGIQFKNKHDRLHPALEGCRANSSLQGNDRSFWDNYQKDDPAYAHLDDLDRCSLMLHRIAMDKADVHIPLIEKELAALPEGHVKDDMTAAAAMIAGGSLNSGYIWNTALTNARAEYSDSELLDRLNAAEKLSESVLERNSYRDYKDGDRACAQQLGTVIIFGKKYQHIVKQLSLNLRDNASALMLIDPLHAYFIVPTDITEFEKTRLTSGLKSFVKQRKMRTELSFADAQYNTPAGYRAALKALVGPYEDIAENEGGFCADLTGASASFSRIVSNMPCFTASDGIADFDSCADAVSFNRLSRRISVRDVFALGDEYAYDYWSLSAPWQDIDKHVHNAFKAYLALTDSKADASTVRDTLYTNSLCGFISSNQEGYSLKLKKKVALIAEGTPDEELEEFEADVDVTRANKLSLPSVLMSLDGYGVIRVKKPKESANGCVKFRWLANKNYREPLKLFDGSLSADDPLRVTAAQSAIIISQQTLRITPDSKLSNHNREAFTAFGKAGLLRTDADGCWHFVDAGARALLAKEGNVLEDYLYSECARSGLFSDLSLGYSYGHAFARDKVYSEFGKHEIDLLGITHDNTIVFFETKLGTNITVVDVEKFDRVVRSFGFSGARAVFVASVSDLVLANKGMQPGGSTRAGAEQMLSMYFITRSHLRDRARLRRRLELICKGVAPSSIEDLLEN